MRLRWIFGYKIQFSTKKLKWVVWVRLRRKYKHKQLLLHRLLRHKTLDQVRRLKHHSLKLRQSLRWSIPRSLSLHQSFRKKSIMIHFQARMQYLLVKVNQMLLQQTRVYLYHSLRRKSRTCRWKERENPGLVSILVLRIHEHSYGILLTTPLNLCGARLEKLQCLLKLPMSNLEKSL